MKPKTQIIKEIRESLDMWRNDLFDNHSQKITCEEMDIVIFTGELIVDFFDQFDNELKKLARDKE